MAKGPPPAWNRRDCRFDHLVGAALGQGPGKELIYKDIDSFDRADDVRRGIYRCAKHRGLTADAGPSRPADQGKMGMHRQPDGKWQVRFRVFDKRAGRKHHIQTYGSDRSQWPYDPRRRATAEERASWANRDEQGNPVIHD